VGGFGLASGQDEAVADERPKFGVGLLDEATRENNSGDDARCQQARMGSIRTNATGVVLLEWWVLLARLGSCLHLLGHPKLRRPSCNLSAAEATARQSGMNPMTRWRRRAVA